MPNFCLPMRLSPESFSNRRLYFSLFIELDLVVKTRGKFFAATKVEKNVPSPKWAGTLKVKVFEKQSYCANRASLKNSSSVSVFKNAINFAFSCAESGIPKVPSGRRSSESSVGVSLTPDA